MARARRTSTVLETARRRLAGLKSITPAPDFGTALSVASFETLITTFGGKLDTYNQHVAALDDEQNDIDSTEDTLREMNGRMLSAAQASFGPDSSEYEAVGGTRISERRRSPKPADGSPPSTSPPSS
jgi:hypothetical protein